MKRWSVVLLILAIVVSFSTSAIGFGVLRDGRKCTLMKGAKIIQVMPGSQPLRGTVVLSDTPVVIHAALDNATVLNLISWTGMDWRNAHAAITLVDFGNGPITIAILIKPTDVKDCK